MDLPLRMESDIVENEDGPGPYGSKGMSEGALLCVAPAVAAAVRDATGVVIRDLPLTPGAGLARASARRRPGRTRSRATRRRRRDLRLRPRRSRMRSPRRGRRALVGGKAANLGRDGARARPAGAARLRHHHRDLPRLPGRAAGRPASTTSCASGWPRSRRPSGVASATPTDPLLVSVRSGAPVSMPGMMDTILNLGLNDATTAGLAPCAGRRGVRPRAAASASTASFRDDRRRRRRPATTRGTSSGWRSRPCSAPGTATAPGPIARRRASPTTSGRR